ncbi:MAG: hypothetical protein ACREOU_16915 [Candidatus Eiseniibacteriota bacterium]
MDDRFLYQARKAPDPAFEAELKQRLDRQSPVPGTEEGRSGLAGLFDTLGRVLRRPEFAAAGGLGGLIAVLVLFPSVRASAQAFLDLFRVRNFVAVPVDPARFENLENMKLDPKSLLGEPEILKKPVMRTAGSPAEASAFAGYAVRTPTFVPEGYVADTVVVTEEAEARFRVDAGKLNAVLNALEIRDVALPPNLDGAQVSVHTRNSVTIRYRKNAGSERERRIVFAQSPSPEIELPQGLDLPRLGEIGLRIAGLPADEARRFASSIDWHSTMLVPVPAKAAAFREVDVRGQRGLLIDVKGDAVADSKTRRRVAHDGSILLWSDMDRVYALRGDGTDLDLVHMANTVQ